MDKNENIVSDNIWTGRLKDVIGKMVAGIVSDALVFALSLFLSKHQGVVHW